MDLVLEDKLQIGLITIHRRTEPATGPWLPSIGELCELVELVDACRLRLALVRRPHLLSDGHP